jgi:hypothetical protein
MSDDIAGYVPVFATVLFYFFSKFMASNSVSLQQLVLLSGYRRKRPLQLVCRVAC